MYPCRWRHQSDVLKTLELFRYEIIAPRRFFQTMDPRKQYEGKLEDYPLTNYPDYEPGHPPRSERLEKIGFLDEVEKIWGSRWGGSAGIGRLREVD
jgi:hypothetical protein